MKEQTTHQTNNKKYRSKNKKHNGQMNFELSYIPKYNNYNNGRTDTTY